MRDDPTTPATPEQMQLVEEGLPGPESAPADPRVAVEPAIGGAATDQPTAEDLQAAELSRAAREAVRQPADPRIDRQLARMGLAGEDEPDAAGAVRPAGRALRIEDVDRLEMALAATREALAEVQQHQAAAGRRVNLLAWAVTLEGLAVAILAIVVLLTIR